MKKIAILRCLKTSASCAATGCLRAFNEKDKKFARYAGEDIQLGAVWTCNGCGKSLLENQEGLETKIARMQKNSFDVVHLSSCTLKKQDDGTKVLCPNIARIAERLQAMGIEIVEGTHHSE